MRVVSTLVVILGLLAVQADAQLVYERIHTFREIPHGLAGGLVEGPDGTLYGVAATPGFGAILKFVRSSDGTLLPSPLHRFTLADGQTPNGLTYASDGNLYGTTCHGGAAENGTIFRLSPDGTFTSLYHFDAAGRCPTSIVEGADGNLYGTVVLILNMYVPVSHIFRITKAGVFAPVAEVSPVAGEGFGPLIAAPDGHLYALTGFRLVRIALSGAVTTVHDFRTSGITAPRHLVRGIDGNFYGTTLPYDNLPSRVFRVTPSGTATVLATILVGSGTVMKVEQGLDGALYVVAETSSLHGSVFRLVPGGSPTTIHTFTYNDGAAPTQITRLSDGTLYGSTTQGGTSRRGVVFRIDAAARVHVATTFSDPTPLHPQGPMVIGPDGALYGTTCDGGVFNAGTVFRLGTGETVPTVVHSFGYWDGSCPRGALAVGADGALYGAAAHHGLRFGGTLFKVTTTGLFTPLRFFSGPDGFRPRGGLLRASDGHFYGTTSGYLSLSPFVLHPPTIFRLSSTGTFTTLDSSSLGLGHNNYGAVAPLIQGSDGHIYGGSDERAFRMSLDGDLTTFAMPDRTVLTAPFAEGEDSAMYGLSWTHDSTRATGAVFRLTTGGVEPPLATFAGAPIGGLLRAPDGLFYGTSYGDNSGNWGSVFQFAPSGSLITLHAFSGVDDDGVGPQATLTQTPDGAMYGSTAFGGTERGGTLFQLVPAAAPSLVAKKNQSP